MWLLAASFLLAQQAGTITGRVHSGGTAGVRGAVVYVRSGLPARAKYQAPTAPAAVTVRGCRFEPGVVAVMVGQALEIRNADSVPRRLRLAATRNRTFDVTLAAGARIRRHLAIPEVAARLACVERPDDGAAVAVLGHPFFAVTPADGRYALSGLQPGTYLIDAWHGRLGARSATVSVAANQRVAQDFRLAAP